jgi:hypothetical protein
MSRECPPANDPVSDRNGRMTQSWYGHFLGEPKARNFTVAELPSARAEGPGALVYVSDESGGAVLAFSDGTHWRRSTDRAIVS